MKNNKGIEYQMTKKMFDAILGTRTEEEKKGNPYNYVMDYINEQYCLKGSVKHISIRD